MNRLIATEWLKIKHYQTFWVMMGLFTVFLVLVNYSIGNGGLHVSGGATNLLNTSYAFPGVWDNICYYSSYFVLFLAILVIILVTNEFQFKTNRQNVIDGWGRMDFYHAKWAVVIMLGCYTALVVFVAGLAFGFANGGSASSMFVNANKVLYLFLLSMHYYAFALLLALLFKRSGLAIGMLLLYFTIIKNMLSGMLTYIYSMPNSSCFIPLKCSDELLPFPAFNMINKMVSGVAGAGPDANMLLLASACWVVVFYFLGRLLLQKSDW